MSAFHYNVCYIIALGHDISTQGSRDRSHRSSRPAADGKDLTFYSGQRVNQILSET